MSVDHLQIGIIDVIYNGQNWLYETLSGAGNDVNDALNDFNGALENIASLTKYGALVSSTDTTGADNMQWEAQDPVYGGSSYLTSINASNLRSDVITQLATIDSLTSYKDVAIRSYRNDLQGSDDYSYGAGAANEGLEIFISGCKFKTIYYQESVDIDTLLSRVNDALDAISGLEFAGILVACTRSSNDNLFIGVDDATYNGNKYLALTNAINLRNSVLSALSGVSELDDTDIDVEIRISKKDDQSSD